MEFTRDVFDILKEKEFFNFDSNLESVSKAITVFNKPLTDIEMDYFNNSIKSFKNLFSKYQFHLANQDFQKFIFYHLKDEASLHDISSYFQPINELFNDFQHEFSFNNMNAEKALFLVSYCFFEEYKYNKLRDSFLNIEAKNGHIYFTHATDISFAPRIRDRYSFLISLFFDKNRNIFNGISIDNKGVIEPREYLTLLQCKRNENNAIEKYSYICGNFRSISYNDILWNDTLGKSTELLTKHLSLTSDFLFTEYNQDVVKLKQDFENLKHALIKNRSDSLFDNLSNIEFKDFQKFTSGSTLRYEFSYGKFNLFFSDIKRSHNLFEEMHKVDKSETIKISRKGKI